MVLKIGFILFFSFFFAKMEFHVFFLLTLGYMILKITLITVCGLVCAFDRGGVL